MLKHIYRAIILIAVFAGALYYFSRDIKEVVFDIDNTTEMTAATFPLITIKTGDSIVNRLHGYSTSLAANTFWEAVTPLDEDQTFEVQFDKDGPEIKKLNYELREFVGNELIETNSVSVFEDSGDYQTAKIKLNTQLDKDKEYAVKITLITSKSEKIYYYQRVKIYEEAHLKDKLDFVMYFHDTILNKDKAEDIIKYLEPSNDADNTTLAYVNINSSFDLVCWSGLTPTVLTDIIPTVKEIYTDTASIELDYYIQAEAEGTPERYHVTEFYRVRYSADRMYLLNYERYMESVFDVGLADVAKNELKLGITSDYEIPYKAGADATKLAFVRDKDLYFYDLSENKITKVFTFRQDEPDYLRDYYDQHDIRILTMDAEGNIDFLVYGYMNRGQYEGRVAVILYRYIRAEQRIEELVYIPVEEPYQTLKENMGELAYLNSSEVFYIQMHDTIYSYNLITRKLSEIATGVDKDQVVVLSDINYVVWQDQADLTKSKNVYIMDLESGKTETISAKEGYNIRLLGKIDNNIIYGFVKDGNIISLVDGSILVPLSTVNIASVDKKVLKNKNYGSENYYITGITVKDNVIDIKRVKKVEEEGRITYLPASDDNIMNQEKQETAYVDIASRTTEDQLLTQYYMTLPSSFVMKAVPKVLTTVNTVIDQDPTVRLTEAGMKQIYYYPYVTGGIAGAYENAADAIVIARQGIGEVLNSNRQLVWERGVKTTTGTITRFENMKWTASSENTVEACLKLVLEYQGVQVSTNSLNISGSSAYEKFKTYSKHTPVRLTGISLEDAFYYICKGRPVIAMTDSENAVVIYGYDTFNILVINPAKSTVSKMGIQDATAMFGAAGNIFLSYLE